ncbi:hemolysin family protein [Pseudalkalibacillus caeni]|uniref:HlyC/CorC family transporter n=1 Tax=Exobacillus caeni TaxID=2574798 RepID=A0A5R9F608_9BACL|nr:hemolysin family protein [Pseudalkalibacillus caeni]TLS37929.1 HlyC/CorC family transporter [Pseudalkalibacillus caeni]
MELLINLLLVAFLILLTAFFVAAEFSIIRVRRTRIDNLAESGNGKAIAVQMIINDLDGYLSACQLGITITSLGLGWLGEPTVEHLLHPVFEKLALNETLSSTLSFVIAFASITFLHVVLGELAPKTIAIQRAEGISLLLARPLILFNKIMYPFIWALNGSARVFVRLFGFKTASEGETAHTEEELRLILSESYESGEINQTELQYVNRIFEFDNRVAREIMIPRKEMVVLYKDLSLTENLKIIDGAKYTRYPVANEDKDDIVGIINIKEVYHAILNEHEPIHLTDYTRPVISVVENTPIQTLLIKMQKDRIHMAIIVDEYGGTSGLVTVEDILEEIVGEIRDEFDIDERPMIEQIDEQTTMVDGKVLVSQINERFELELDDDEFDTIGGWFLAQKFDVERGTEVEHENYRFKAVDVEGHQVKTIEVIKE